MPFPHLHYRAPAVAGVITEHGKPAAGASVRVSGQFSAEVSAAVSDQEGRFVTKPIREVLLTASLLGDPMYGYTVSIIMGGKEYVGYSDAYVGYAPKEIQLVCDLGKPLDRGGIKVHCTAQGDGSAPAPVAA